MISFHMSFAIVGGQYSSYSSSLSYRVTVCILAVLGMGLLANAPEIGLWHSFSTRSITNPGGMRQVFCWVMMQTPTRHLGMFGALYLVIDTLTTRTLWSQFPDLSYQQRSVCGGWI